MVSEMQFEQAMATRMAIGFVDGYEYTFIYPKILTDDTNIGIVRELGKRTIDFSVSTPSWSAETTYDVATPSTLTTPVNPYRYSIGYDYEEDQILILLGEKATGTSFHNITDAVLLGVDRDFGGSDVLQADLLTLVKSTITDATKLDSYGTFSGHGGDLVGAIGVYAGTSERSCILKRHNASWTCVHANSFNNYLQQGLEPIWSAADAFLGWLTEGHGLNSYYIKASDLSLVHCAPPNGVFTHQPVYNSVHHNIIWCEWGNGTGYVQHIHVGDPDATYGCISFIDKTPPGGFLIDNEMNSLSLRTVQKVDPTIFSDGLNTWLTMMIVRYDYPTYPYTERTAKVDIGYYAVPDYWAILSDTLNNDKLSKYNITHVIDPVTGLFVPSPLIICQQQE